MSTREYTVIDYMIRDEMDLEGNDKMEVREMFGSDHVPLLYRWVIEGATEDNEKIEKAIQRKRIKMGRKRKGKIWYDEECKRKRRK